MINKTSQKGVNFIRLHEGCRCEAYNDSVGVLTIGYGHTGSDITPNMKITLDQAQALLVKDLAKFEANINTLNLNLNQNQYDAIVDFCYNLGFGSFKQSTLLKKIQANPADLTIKDEFLKWNKAGGKELQGLTVRRNDEAKLYFS